MAVAWDYPLDAARDSAAEGELTNVDSNDLQHWPLFRTEHELGYLACQSARNRDPLSDPADLPTVSVLQIGLDSYDALVATACMGETA